MSRDRERFGFDEEEWAAEKRRAGSPGKRTLTMGLPKHGGQPLPESLRTPLERHAKVPLGTVRVHTGPESAAAAAKVGARAFAQGQDIHFAAGAYEPHSRDGQGLIAHEVAHTVQQRGGAGRAVQTKLEVSQPGDRHEVQADQWAATFLCGKPPPELSSAPSSVVQRQASGAAQQVAEPSPSRGKGQVQMWSTVPAFEYKKTLGKRWGAKLKFDIKRKNPAVYQTSREIDEDTSVKLKTGEIKAKVELAAGKFAPKIAVALLKGELAGKLGDHVTITYGAAESLGSGKLGKLSVMLKGDVTKLLFPDSFANEVKVGISGGFELSIPLKDALLLTAMGRAQRRLEKLGAQADKVSSRVKRLTRQSTALNESIATMERKLQRPEKLSKWERRLLPGRVHNARGELSLIKLKLEDQKAWMADAKEQVLEARDEVSKKAKRLRFPAARNAGKAIRKLAEKKAARILFKLLPAFGWISDIYDVLRVAVNWDKITILGGQGTSTRRPSAGGGSGKPGGAEGNSNTGSKTRPDGKQPTLTWENLGRLTTQGAVSGGARAGRGRPGSRRGRRRRSPRRGKVRPRVRLHAQAEAVARALASRAGAELGDRHKRRLNRIVSADMSREQLELLLRELSMLSKTQAQNADEALERVREFLAQRNAGPEPGPGDGVPGPRGSSPELSTVMAGRLVHWNPRTKRIERHPKARARMRGKRWRAKDGTWGKVVDVRIRRAGSSSSASGQQLFDYEVQLVIGKARKLSPVYAHSYEPGASGSEGTHWRRSSWNPQALVAPLLRVTRDGRVVLKSRRPTFVAPRFSARIDQVEGQTENKDKAAGRWIGDVRLRLYVLSVQGSYEVRTPTGVVRLVKHEPAIISVEVDLSLSR